MRIINMKRFFISMTLLSLIASMSMNLIFSTMISHGDDINTYISHSVSKGETVWDIAEIYNDGNDIRDLVYEIAIENNLNNFTIRPGQILTIPTN
ncbi:MAG: LysM peptidoglycan-binding domain-containing protein [Clostridiales bacterium]|nr:LysM peptidoglycan-binding domain-containing protein [Clostridiales bacterium]